MSDLRQSVTTEVRDPAFALLLAAIATSMIKGVDQPGLSLDLAGTSARIVVSDLLLVALTVVVGRRVARSHTYPRDAATLTFLGIAFGALILVTSIANGGTAFVAAGKLVTLSALLFGCVVLIDSTDRFWVVTLLIVIVTAAAVAGAVVGFVQEPGRRQASFVGEHDLAALGTACLVLGLAALQCRHRLSWLPLAAGIIGCLGIVLGAALASLLGLYIASAVLITIAAVRHALRVRSLVITLLVGLVLTGAVYSLRANDLGFLQKWFAPIEDADPSRYAGGWNQRLIFAYIGGRVFIDQPVLGTGWWGELPPPEYAQYLPDAHERFAGQPANYFPTANGTFVPQQTFDQVAFELGIVGLTVFLALIATAARDSRRAARRWPRDGPDELAAYLAAAWLASLLGAIAGSALFGGTPMAALFWLTFGLIGALTLLSRGTAASGWQRT